MQKENVIKTQTISARIPNTLFVSLKKKAKEEHRSLTSMLITIIADALNN